jgi:DNA-directed RNA polymerase subunit RPC12/RpoP
MDQSDDSKEKPNLQPRTYGCIKCGSSISAYPPDDVHDVASRDRSTFLDAIETTYVCSKCNEITRLYWGRPVRYRGIVVALSQIYGGIGRIVGRAGIGLRRGASEEDAETEAPPMSTEPPEELENRIYDYILENGGAITVGRASEDLGIPADLITQVIERMTLDGRLKQYSDAEQAQNSMIA